MEWRDAAASHGMDALGGVLYAAEGMTVEEQGCYLLASLGTTPTDAGLGRLQHELVALLVARHAAGVVIDVTAADVLDSSVTRAIRNLASVARLKGALLVVVGVQPEVACVMVQMGLSLDGVPTAFSAQDGIAYLERQSGAP